MSECLVRMEMPHDGLCDLEQTLIYGLGTYCAVNGERCNYSDTGTRPDYCPIICSLPGRHGRLVDAEEMYKKSETFCNQCRQGEHDCEKCNYIVAQGYMYKSPTIVPASH